MNGVVHALSGPGVAQPAERLAQLFDAHYDRLYRLARRLVSSSDAAQDLVQETFLKAARSIASIPAGAEEPWLVRVLVNIRRDEWRKSKVRKRYATVADPAGGVHDGERALIASATIWRALDALPPRRRAIVVLYELDGLPMATIASLLGITAITARWHLSKGRRDLARILGVGEDDDVD